MIRLLFLCLGLLFSYSSGAQASADSLFQRGNQAYAEGAYQEAIQQYQSSLERGTTSAALYNNLGLAYLGEKDLAEAILSFERALALQPTLADAQHNLEVAKQYQVDVIYPMKPFVLIDWWQQLRASASSDAWALLSLLATFAFAAAWIWRWQKRTSWLIPVVFLLLSLLFGSLAMQSYQEATDRSSAIVMAEEATLYQAPQVGSQHLRSLHAGVKVELLEKQGEWQQVRLANAQVGWVLIELVETI